MIPNWENIKKAIAAKQAPVPPSGWDDMQTLLDTHWPVKKKSRFIWYLLPLAVLLFGGTLTYFLSISAVNNEVPPTEKLIITPTIETVPATTSSQTITTIANDIDDDAYEFKVFNQSSQVEIISSKQQLSIAELQPLKFNFYQTNLPHILVMNEAFELATKASHQTSQANRWELKIFAASTYNIPNYTRNAVTNYTHVDYADVSIDGLQAGWGFDAGVELSYYVTQNIRLSSGISFREIRTQNNFDHAVNKIPVIDSATQRILGYINNPNPMQVSDVSQNRFAYIGIPISLFAEWPITQKWSVTGEFKNSLNILISQQSQILNSQNLQTEAADNNMFKPLFMSYQALIGTRYRLQPNLSLAIEGGYRGVYSDMLQSEYASWKPSDFSFNLGLIIHLHTTKNRTVYEK